MHVVVLYKDNSKFKIIYINDSRVKRVYSVKQKRNQRMKCPSSSSCRSSCCSFPFRILLSLVIGREHLRQLETVLCSMFNLIKSLRIHMLLNIDCLRETIRVCFAITKKQVNCVSEVLDAAYLQEFACWARWKNSW